MKNFNSRLKHFELFSKSFKGDSIFYDVTHVFRAVWLNKAWIKGNVCITTSIPDLQNKKVYHNNIKTKRLLSKGRLSLNF